MCKIAVNEEPRMTEFISDQYITQEICKSAVKERLFALIYVLFHYQGHQISNEAVLKYSA